MRIEKTIAIGASLLGIFAFTSAAMVGGGGDDDVPGFGEPGGPSRDLTPDELAQWIRGRKVFDHDFHRSEGLGAPGINGDSCRACHQDPVLGGSGGLELNVTRMGNDNGGAGPFTNVAGGQGLSKFYPPYIAGREESPNDADVFEQRQTPTLLGAGLLDSILESDILAHEDPTDADGDGIYGYARMVDVGGGVIEVGRFGWKAQAPRVFDFIRDAMGGECGITTPDDGRGFALVSDGDPVPDPELSQEDFDDIQFFLELLGPPIRGGNENNPNVALGEQIFQTVGCAKCHIPVMQGATEPVPVYSNLLVHNVMGPNYRGMAEPGAPAGFFKTAPLWGVKDTAPYMHDGRAQNLDGAIRAHRGEALEVRMAFESLPILQQRALVLFLEDL